MFDLKNKIISCFVRLTGAAVESIQLSFEENVSRSKLSGSVDLLYDFGRPYITLSHVYAIDNKYSMRIESCTTNYDNRTMTPFGLLQYDFTIFFKEKTQPEILSSSILVRLQEWKNGGPNREVNITNEQFGWFVGLTDNDKKVRLYEKISFDEPISLEDMINKSLTKICEHESIRAAN